MVSLRSIVVGFVAFAGVALLPTAGGAQAGNSLAGQWRGDDGKAVITLAPCGMGKMCGRISRVLVAQPEGGARDRHNPDASLRSRPLVGVTILSDLVQSNGRWTGRGYSPEEGRNFTATVRVNGNRMDVRGCVAVFCRTVGWTRVTR